jgi:hypothetical protein
VQYSRGIEQLVEQGLVIKNENEMALVMAFMMAMGVMTIHESIVDMI